MCLAIIPHKATIITVVDLGEGPQGVRAPLFLDQTQVQRTEKIFFEDPPFSKGLDDPLPLSQGLDPTLH